MPQSGQLLLFLPLNDRSRQSEVSDRDGDDGAEQDDEHVDDGDSAGDDDLDEDRLRSTG